MKSRRLLTNAVLLALAMPLSAADPSSLLNLGVTELSEIKVDTVFAASKFGEKVTDVPSSVTIVTRNEIARLGYRTLADVIRGVRSFDVTYDRNLRQPGGPQHLQDSIEQDGRTVGVKVTYRF
jgi:outer membrane receptor for ferrienterochelin and colicin